MARRHGDRDGDRLRPERGSDRAVRDHRPGGDSRGRRPLIATSHASEDRRGRALRDIHHVELTTILTTGPSGSAIDSLTQGNLVKESVDNVRRSYRGGSVGGRHYGRGPRPGEDLRGRGSNGPCLEGRGPEHTPRR